MLGTARVEAPICNAKHACIITSRVPLYNRQSAGYIYHTYVCTLTACVYRNIVACLCNLQVPGFIMTQLDGMHAHILHMHAVNMTINITAEY